MKVIGLWYGGSSYAAPNGHDPRDCERFDSLRDARATFESRADNFDGRTPCVSTSPMDYEYGQGSEMHLYRGTEYHEDGPDWVLTMGPRGGVRQGRG